MAKRKTFEEILESEFRWPRKGDLPFQQSEEGHRNAWLAPDTKTRLVLMTEGYKKAADLAANQSIASIGERDFLVFPIIFNYRQFLELSLKYIISTYGPAVGIRAIWNSHNLITLWRSFSALLEEYGSEDPDQADSIVAQTVAEFSKIDPGSFSHRYPVDTSGNSLPLTHQLLDLEVLMDVMNGVAGYFTGCDAYLSKLQDAGP